MRNTLIALKLSFMIIRLKLFFHVIRHFGSALFFTLRYGRQKSYMTLPSDRDFGNLVDKGNQETIFASNAEEIIQVFKRAHLLGKTVNVGGATHSVKGQTLSAGGLRLLLKPPATEEIKFVGDNLVEVSTAVKWDILEKKLQEHGQSCPVLTDNWSTTIGGTLSVGGGIGTRSLIYGRQIDAVKRLHLVTPRGDQLWCSPTEHPEVFKFALGGLGQLGVIDRVVLQTIDYLPYTVCFSFQHINIEQAVNCMLKIEEDLPNNLRHFQILGHLFASNFTYSNYGFEFATKEAARQFIKMLPPVFKFMSGYLQKKQIFKTPDYILMKEKMVRGGVLNQSNPAHIWTDWMFTNPQEYLQFVHYIEKDFFAKYGKQSFCVALVYLLKQFPQQTYFPLSYSIPSPSTAMGHTYTLGIFYNVPTHQVARIDALKEGFKEAQDKCISLNGRPYLYGWNELNQEDMYSLYGNSFTQLIQLKNENDPHNILNADIFPGIAEKNTIAMAS